VRKKGATRVTISGFGGFLIGGGDAAVQSINVHKIPHPHHPSMFIANSPHTNQKVFFPDL
jgi:hypothetical protein